MNLATLADLYQYHYRARDMVIECVRELSDADYFKPLDYSIGSIHEQVSHMMGAEALWFSRMRGTSPKRILTGADFDDLDAVMTYWDDEVKPMVLDYIGSVTVEDLDRIAHYQTTKGDPQTVGVLGLLLHVVNHGTDHRAQILAMLHTMGAPTKAQDLIYYYRGQL